MNRGLSNITNAAVDVAVCSLGVAELSDIAVQRKVLYIFISPTGSTSKEQKKKKSTVTEES